MLPERLKIIPFKSWIKTDDLFLYKVAKIYIKLLNFYLKNPFKNEFKDSNEKQLIQK